MTAKRLILILLPLAILQAQPDRVPTRIDNSRSLRLSGRVHAFANAQNDRGPVASGFQVPGITLLLRSSTAQQQDLRQLLQDQQDPSSPNYHKWLTPDQYADRFGASANDAARIVDWLQSQGLTVTNVARSRMWITFNGTADRVGTAFRTSIHRYSVSGESHYANATEPSIPAALADVVAGFRGLHDFHLKPRVKKVSPDLTQGGQHYLAPDDFSTIYDVTPLYKAGIDGTGQAIAIVGQTALRTSDITSFRNQFNLGRLNLQQMLVPGRPNPGVVSGDIDEANLDIEWSGAVARNATIYFVYSDDVWQSAYYTVDQDFAPILSMSYGECEKMDLADLPSEQAAVQQANAEGITWFGPAGDAGAADCELTGTSIAQTGLAVDVPASIPEVTAMGGTEFNDQGGTYWSSSNGVNSGSALSYIPERAWNDTSSLFGLNATGGGASIFFPQPSWQTGPGVPADGVRHVPDISVTASDLHVPYFFISGVPGVVGGTSAAAPTMAGIFSLLNQYLVSTGAQAQPGLGNINPTLYRMAQATTNVFHDVTSGDNAVPCAAGSPDCPNGSLGLAAGPAYDQVTGWGSVDAFNLVHQWTSNLPSASAMVASVDQNPVFQQPAADSNGNQWIFKLTLNEEAGVATTLTDFTVDGVSFASQIPQLFGSSVIPARGSISAAYGFATLDVPRTVVFGFTGVDGGGQQWTLELQVPFQGPQIPLAATSMSNAASGQAVYAPGMILSIYGTALADFAQSSATIPLPQFMAGFTATINGVQAPLFYVSPTQVNIQIPYETTPGPAALDLTSPYQDTTYTIQVTNAGPGIFTFADGTINPSNTGSQGQSSTLFITGDGQVTPPLATGAAPPPGTSAARLPKPRLPVTVTVGGLPAPSTVVGIPSGKIGMTQITFTIPPTVPPGMQAVVVTVGTAASPPAYINVSQ